LILLNYTITPKGGIKTKMKIWKSKKALSPVVASIILIAVTVAVSIAVAAWMGALTFTFMKTEPYNIVSVNFGGTTNSSSNTIVLRVQNTGTASFTVTKDAKVNGVAKTLLNSLEVTIAAGSTQDVTISNVQWINGRTYNIEMITAQGTKITYIANAPQT
jgi:flagellin-like protein